MKSQNENKPEHVALPPAEPETERDEAPAWAMIEPGRYQPRRIRGSNRGRELG
jgi:hypothetical protein